MRKIHKYRENVAKLCSREFTPPITCEVDLSNDCQLNCKFCMFKKHRRGREYLNLNAVVLLVEDLVSIGVKSITFTGGGEPTLHSAFNTIVSFAMSRGLDIGLVTNGVDLWKVNHSNVDRYKFIRVSLDAPNREIYYSVKGRDKFDSVVSGIEGLVKKGAYVGISYVVYEDNEGGIEECIERFEGVDVSYIQFKPAWFNGSMYQISESALNVMGGFSNSIFTNRRLERDKVACSIAGLVGVVCADGEVYYCCQHRGKSKFRLGSIYHEEFSSIWERRVWLDFDIENCPHCRYMNYAVDLRDSSLGATHIDMSRHINFL